LTFCPFTGKNNTNPLANALSTVANLGLVIPRADEKLFWQPLNSGNKSIIPYERMSWANSAIPTKRSD